MSQIRQTRPMKLPFQHSFRAFAWGSLVSLIQVLLASAVLASQDPVPQEPVPPPPIPVEKIRLPQGFKIEVFARGLKGAREMTLGKEGNLFVGSRETGSVYAVTPKGEVLTVAQGLHSPNGVAFRNGALYVAEISRILRLDGIEAHLKDPVKPAVVRSDLPTDEWHGWKFIAFGPDGWLYVPVGAPCNECERKDPRFASILRMKPDGSQLENFAHGVRNTVGFDWDPSTHELWFTDNGRDMLGDDVPPDELNHAPKQGMNFGFPYCHGGDLPDPELKSKKPCSEFTPPERKLPAHVAALGMRFYTGQAFPQEYRNQIFIAEHGSWNRSVPVGYRVTLVRLKDGKAVSYAPFAEGWLQGDKAWGRPVDVLVHPDGSLLVSDDLNGVIYRISCKANSLQGRNQ